MLLSSQPSRLVKSLREPPGLAVTEGEKLLFIYFIKRKAIGMPLSNSQAIDHVEARLAVD